MNWKAPKVRMMLSLYRLTKLEYQALIKRSKNSFSSIPPVPMTLGIIWGK